MWINFFTRNFKFLLYPCVSFGSFWKVILLFHHLLLLSIAFLFRHCDRVIPYSNFTGLTLRGKGALHILILILFWNHQQPWFESWVIFHISLKIMFGYGARLSSFLIHYSWIIWRFICLRAWSYRALSWNCLIDHSWCSWWLIAPVVRRLPAMIELIMLYSSLFGLALKVETILIHINTVIWEAFLTHIFLWHMCVTKRFYYSVSFVRARFEASYCIL